MKRFSKELLFEIIRAVLSVIGGIVLLYIGYTYFNTTNPSPSSDTRRSPSSLQRKSEIEIEQVVTTPVRLTITYVYRPQGRGAFRPISNGGVMQSGDVYKIIFTPQETCYVYIFQVDAAEMVYRLFPIQRFNGITVNQFNPVQGGTTYYAPSQQYSFELDRQTGQETIFFLASRQRDAELEHQYEIIELAQRQEHVKQYHDAQSQFLRTMRGKGVAAITRDAGTITWQEQGEQFSAFKYRLNICHGCVNVLTFTHEE